MTTIDNANTVINYEGAVDMGDDMMGRVAADVAAKNGGTVQHVDAGTDRERHVVSFADNQRAVICMDDAWGTETAAVLVTYEQVDSDGRWSHVGIDIVES